MQRLNSSGRSHIGSRFAGPPLKYSSPICESSIQTPLLALSTPTTSKHYSMLSKRTLKSSLSAMNWPELNNDRSNPLFSHLQRHSDHSLIRGSNLSGRASHRPGTSRAVLHVHRWRSEAHDGYTRHTT